MTQQSTELEGVRPRDAYLRQLVPDVLLDAVELAHEPLDRVRLPSDSRARNTG
jgi:hypothetical protein